MAPLTRNRSPRAVPNDLNVAYYEQRASAGLLITEATAISHQGQGYADVPGLYKPEALVGWRKVTDAVHKAGGKIVVQMWHGVIEIRPLHFLDDGNRLDAWRIFSAAGSALLSQW